jgi:hypothetical protein
MALVQHCSEGEDTYASSTQSKEIHISRGGNDSGRRLDREKRLNGIPFSGSGSHLIGWAQQ